MTYTDHLSHLVWIAKMDKAYAWARAQEMAADKSGLWAAIADDLKRDMLVLKSAQEVLNRGG